ncbi:hypothetical protein LINGRAHAP2_LOCUS7730 [Linum grandiflorum]
MMEENHQSLKGRLARVGQNHKHVIFQLKSLDEHYKSYNSRVDRCLKMRELPPRGRNSTPTFNILVDQTPMHGFCQPPSIPIARTYMAPANMGGGVGLSGVDRIPPHAYPRLMPPQLNGQGMDPMRFILPGVQQGVHEHVANALREQVTQLFNEQFGFDNSKSDLIFDHFYKDGQVKLTRGHNIPPPKKLKEKKYCKWHNSMSHSTEHCVTFRNIFHITIEKGHVKFLEPKKDAMLVDTDHFPNVLGINMVKQDFSKVEWPHFKQVLNTTPPSHATPNVASKQGVSSSDMQANPAAFVVSSIANKLYLCCNTSLTFDEDPRLGPSLRPWYYPYQTQVEGVRQPAWGHPRQWTGYDSHPMRRTFRIPNVPPGVWYTYDSCLRRPIAIAIAEMTRTQTQKFLHKNIQACRDHYVMVSGKVAGASLINRDFKPHITMDYSMATDIKVMMADKDKHVQVQSKVDLQEGYESLQHKKMKKNCIARGHTNDVNSRPGGMISNTKDGQEGVSKKAQHVQAIHGCVRHAS